MKTFLPQVDTIERRWHVVDASDQVLGRLASRVASILMGKEKAIYTDFLETGDFVVVVNAAKVRLTGKKWDQKFYLPQRFRAVLGRFQLGTCLTPWRLMENAVRMLKPSSGMGDQEA
jgi:large subunit ribosomal protein L13